MKTEASHSAPCWIKTIGYSQASDTLKTAYDQVRSSKDQVDNLYQSFSLHPHMIKPADDLYKGALHHPDNQCKPVDSELFGCYVAILTECDYALAHHGHNYAFLLGDQPKAQDNLSALKDGDVTWCQDERIVVALGYIKKLTLSSGAMTQSDIAQLRRTGWDDGEILEIVQIVAMFQYFISVINGLGVQLTGETIGAY